MHTTEKIQPFDILNLHVFISNLLYYSEPSCIFLCLDTLLCHPVLFVSVINCVCVFVSFCFVFGLFLGLFFVLVLSIYSLVLKKARYSIPPTIIDSSATEKQVLTSPCEVPSTDCGSLAGDGDYDSCFRTQGKYTGHGYIKVSGSYTYKLILVLVKCHLVTVVHLQWMVTKTPVFECKVSTVILVIDIRFRVRIPKVMPA